jgi:polar amino acid transport system substrate-binding protein
MFRKKLNHRFWILLYCLITLSLITACGTTNSKSNADVKPDENILRVGVSTNSPPLIYKQGKEVVGLEAELAQEFAQYLGKSVRFIEVEWVDQIPALLDNRTDIIMSGMTVTKMRQIRISFSKPYYKTGLMALFHKSNLRNFPARYLARGIQVFSPKAAFGVVKGTTGETYVLSNFSGGRKTSHFDTSKKAVEALLDNYIDLFIHDGPIVLLAASENDTKGLTTPMVLLTDDYLAWGIRKNDIELLNSANRFIDTYKQEGKLNSIISRWMPLDAF